MIRWRALLAFVALIAAGAASASSRHALLVGVSRYDNLPPYLHLRGPANDVTLMNDLLVDRGVDPGNITVLADGVEGAARPTREAILGALGALSPSRGDFVFLYFAGHGSQQPAIPGAGAREPDGLDEIFLPADVGKWDRQIGSVANAITDNDIGAHIVRLRNRGAFVWAVFDSCHSGTLTRALPLQDERERNVDAHSVLGVPQAARSRSVGNALAAPARADDDWLAVSPAEGLAHDAGGFVGFYASQSGETTPELRMPPDDAAGAHHGLFTFQLARILASGRGLSYRQAGQRILQSYAAWHRLRPTPLYEGTALDAPLFGAASHGSGARQWPVRVDGDVLRIEAGRLHGLEEDAVVALLARPAALPDDALGYARVASAALTRSELVATRHGGSGRVQPGSLPDPLFARLVETPVSAAVRVAEPPPGADGLDAYRAAKEIARRHSTSVEWVDAGRPADIRLALDGGRLHLLQPSARVDSETSAISLDLSSNPERDGAALADALRRIGRVIRLSRLSEHATGEAIDFEFALAVRGDDGTVRRVPEDRVPTFGHGDRLLLELANAGSRPVDVTVLHIDSRYGLSVVYPLDVGNRIEPQGRDVVEAQIDASQTTGLERLVVIAIAAAPNAAPADFGFLAQAHLPPPDPKRSGEGSFARLVRDVVAGDGARRGWSLGRARSQTLEQSLVTVRGWNVRAGSAAQVGAPPTGEDDRDET